MIVSRHITGHLKKMLEKFPVLSLTGPRQSGKTTLLRSAFSDYRYYNLERPDTREMVTADPIGFLSGAGSRVIFDEAQNLPLLFSYIQAVSDERKTAGQYILSGSQSFLLSEKISQSLAGRVSVNLLLPFGAGELREDWKDEPLKLILRGFYPRIYDQDIDPDDFYPSYLQTYIERDIRTLRSVENLHTFTRFLGLCAGRAGQILNLSSLAGDAGIAVNTAKAWISLLESSYIVFLLQPYFRNFSRRIIKSPKLYFYDTGIAASLLRIKSPAMLSSHYLTGALYENLVISEIIKFRIHSGIQPAVFYWRESNGVEIDCVIEDENGEITAVEIKAGATFAGDFLRNLRLFPAETEGKKIRKILVYGGTESTTAGDIEIFSWNKFMDHFSLKRQENGE